jgi:hypothetical protein
MNKEVENKLKRIDELREQMKKIDIEISSILGISGGFEEYEEKKKERRGTGVRHCKKCGKEGHRSDHCPSDLSDLSDKPLAPKMPALTPDKLSRIRKMLGEGEPLSFITDEVGVSHEQVERIASTMGL